MLSVTQPIGKVLDVTFPEEGTKTHRQGTHGGEFGRACFERVDIYRLSGRQRSARLDAPFLDREVLQLTDLAAMTAG